MRALVAFAVMLLAGLVASGLAFSAPPPAPAYRVIVHPDNPVVEVDRAFLAEVFLKKVTSWPDGEPIRPADLDPGSPARRRFSEEVLHRTVAEVKAYWQQRIFSGRDVPPPEFGSDEEVVQFVLKHEHAVGYVSGASPLEGTKVLVVK